MKSCIHINCVYASSFHHIHIKIKQTQCVWKEKCIDQNVTILYDYMSIIIPNVTEYHINTSYMYVNIDCDLCIIIFIKICNATAGVHDKNISYTTFAYDTQGSCYTEQTLLEHEVN